ncbi:MAG: hypothetical protein OK455_01945 [Thaumarchaeota archaeon]|nr:hypothetical protein [Nitrososphaerota archaeon]
MTRATHTTRLTRGMAPRQGIGASVSSRTRMTGTAKTLAILLIVFVFCDFLLSPLGFETRGSALLGNPASLPWLGLLFGGLILNIISLILLRSRPRTASILAIVGSIAYIAVGLGDLAGSVSSLRAPVLVADVEVVTIVLLVGVLFFASRVYKERTTSLPRA